MNLVYKLFESDLYLYNRCSILILIFYIINSKQIGISEMTPYNIEISDVHHFKEHILQCERLNLVCNYDSSQVLPEMSRKLAKGLYDNEQTVVSILNYTREKYADIIDCDLICGIHEKR